MIKSIKIEIQGKTFELTPGEALELKMALLEIYPEPVTYPIPVFPCPAPISPYPAYPHDPFPMYPTIICGETTC